jgi:hypothetical protein
MLASPEMNSACQIGSPSRIARLGAAEMGQTGAGDKAVRRVGMIERDEQPPLRDQPGERDPRVAGRRGGDLGERSGSARGAERQLIDAQGVAQRLDGAATLDDPADPPRAIDGNELHQTHALCLPPVCFACGHDTVPRVAWERARQSWWPGGVRRGG